MLLKLLKRDLQLHRLLLIVPLLAILPWGYLGAAHVKDDATEPICVLIVLVTILLPLSFHLRERSEGTMGELASLPIPRAGIVSLRFLEALVLPLLAVLLFGVEGSLVQFLLGTTPSLPMLIAQDFLGHPLVMGWCFFWCCAYPMPALLRWNWKGLGVMVAIPILFLFGLGQALIRVKTFASRDLILETVFGPWQWIKHHHGAEPLLLTGLITLSFFLSVKAFAGRDL
jgi:hypothetical protein